MIDATEQERELLVSIISYCLLPNHFHLLVKQLQPDGIPQFLYRLCMGYSKYFNLRHKRTGPLFEGRYKAIIAEREGHLEHLPRYIHLNALDTTSVKWNSQSDDSWSDVQLVLENYPWSSHSVYTGKSESLGVIDKNEVKKMFPDIQTYWEYLKEKTGTSPGDVPNPKNLTTIRNGR